MAFRVTGTGRFGLIWDDSFKESLLAVITSGTLNDVETILGPDSGPNLIGQGTLNIALETACNCRKKSIVEFLLRSGARPQYCLRCLIDDVTKEGKIITTEEMGIIKLLLENSHTEDKKAVLSKVVSKGRSDLIDLLLTSKVGLNSEDLLSSALFESVRRGYIESIEILIKHGGTIDGERATKAALLGNTQETLKLFPQFYKEAFQNVECINQILYQVVRFGNIDFLKFMMESETNLFNLIKDEDQLLIETNNAEVLQFLIDHGVVVHDSVEICSHVLDLLRKEKLDMAKIFFDSGLNVDSESFKTGHKGTPLTEAANAETVQYLIDKGANVNETVYESVGWEQIISTTALLEALSKEDEVLKVLLENGADPEVTDYKGYSALMAASQILNGENKVEMLLKAGAEVNKLSECGETALSYAASANSTTSVEILLQHGADVNIIGSHRTALLNAVRNRNYKTIQMLVESGMNTETLNTCNEKGNTPLIKAVKLFPDDESSKLINIFTTAGADVNKRNGEGYTALMRAAKEMKHLTLKALIEAGADINATLDQLHSTVSAISILLNNHHKMYQYGQRDSLLCIEELLNHGAHTCNISSLAFEKLMKRNASWLLSKIIQNGYAPDEDHYKSPLYVALENGQDKIARYLLGNRFLTKSDISLTFKSVPCHPICGELLTELTSQPFSLLTLSFVAVSNDLGSGPDREKRVRKTGLPPMLQTKLLFKTEEVSLTVDEEEKNSVLTSFDFEESFSFNDLGESLDDSSEDDFYDYGHRHSSDDENYGFVHYFF